MDCRQTLILNVQDVNDMNSMQESFFQQFVMNPLWEKQESILQQWNSFDVPEHGMFPVDMYELNLLIRDGDSEFLCFDCHFQVKIEETDLGAEVVEVMFDG